MFLIPGSRARPTLERLLLKTRTSGVILIGQGQSRGWPAPKAISGDGTLATTGALTITKTSGVAFAPSATTDTTNASNISSGSLPTARLGLLRGYLSGLGLSGGGSTTLTIALGIACSDDVTTMMSLGSTYTKTFAAWAVGTAAGGLDTGAIAANTWYHVFEIQRTDTNVVDVLISLSATAPTFPANYTKKRRIGSIKTDATPNIIAFIQDGDTFQWLTLAQDIASVNPGTAAVTCTMSTPLGVRVEGVFQISALASATLIDISISDLSVTDEGPGVVGATASLEIITATQAVVANQRVFTNTSSQIRSRSGTTGADLTFYISTRGWVDRRGRDA